MSLLDSSWCSVLEKQDEMAPDYDVRRLLGGMDGCTGPMWTRVPTRDTAFPEHLCAHLDVASAASLQYLF